MKRKAIVIIEDGVQASPNNGISVVALQKGEIYDTLPVFVMEALVESKKARWATEKDIAAALASVNEAGGDDAGDDAADGKAGGGNDAGKGGKAGGKKEDKK